MSIPIVLYIMFYRHGELSGFIFALSILFGVGLGGGALYFCLRRCDVQPKAIFVVAIFGMMMVTVICLPPIGDVFINSERDSIRALRQNKQTADLPFYYNRDEPLRMELVYEMNKTIRPVDIENDSLLRTKTPFVLVSGKPMDSLSLARHFAIDPVGTFDNNWRQVGSKRYNWDLVKYVAIISNEKQLPENATEE